MHLQVFLEFLIAVRSHRQALKVYLLMWAVAVVVAGLVGGWGN